VSSDLSLDVFVSPYKPIVTDVPAMSPGTPTFPASSISFVSGEREAVLIDALLTFDEAKRAAEWIRSKGKKLTTIYITHGHGDHIFGLNTLLAAFPDARAVTRADVFPSVQGQFTPAFLSLWRSMFPGQIPDRPVMPEPLDGDVLELEGRELHLINVGQSDTYPTTIVHIPDLESVVAGDVAYNRIHMWLAQTDHDARLAWIASIDKIAALKPSITVWWSSGAQHGQLTTDGEVDMTQTFSSRTTDALAKGAPLGVEWNQGFLYYDMWSVPKGAPNAKAAMQFINFCLDAKRQAEFARR